MNRLSFWVGVVSIILPLAAAAQAPPAPPPEARQPSSVSPQAEVVEAEADAEDTDDGPRSVPVPLEVLVAADRYRGKALSAARIAADDAGYDGTRPKRGFQWTYGNAFHPNSMEASGSPLDEERRVPKLAARESESTTAGEVLIWIPRVILFPVYLVAEYVIRWPLGVLTQAAERYHVPEYVNEYTTWDHGNGRILPTFRIASGFSPAVGLGAIWENMFIENNDWAVAFDANAGDNLTVDALTRIRFLEDDLRTTLGYKLEFRNDFVVHGIGPDPEQDDEARFSRRKHMGYLSGEVDPVAGGFGGRATLEVASFGFDCSLERDLDICGEDGEFGTDDDLREVDIESGYFTEGYDSARAKGSVFFDSRQERPKQGSGVRVEAVGRYGRGVGNDSSQIEFYRAGGELSLFWDILNQRVLLIQAYAEIAEPLNDRDIPFSELIVMGGVERMRGFNLGRFHGRSALVGTLGYRYPVWSFLDGFVVIEAGNVFEPKFEGLDLGKLHGSGAIGFSTNSTRYQSFDMLLAVGTRKFQDSFSVDSVRVAIGTNWGQ